jgi:D-glycero-D-manno-heptose 1,7-bisphosphate phosphatase
MLLRAARELDLDLGSSFTIGDRLTDVLAGAAAGCRTVLVETGKHREPPIETAGLSPVEIRPDHTCADLQAAAAWLLELRGADYGEAGKAHR